LHELDSDPRSRPNFKTLLGSDEAKKSWRER
jgi:hypothetical protein